MRSLTAAQLWLLRSLHLSCYTRCNYDIHRWSLTSPRFIIQIGLHCNLIGSATSCRVHNYVGYASVPWLFRFRDWVGHAWLHCNGHTLHENSCGNHRDVYMDGNSFKKCRNKGKLHTPFLHDHPEPCTYAGFRGGKKNTWYHLSAHAHSYLYEWRIINVRCTLHLTGHIIFLLFGCPYMYVQVVCANRCQLP